MKKTAICIFTLLITFIIPLAASCSTPGNTTAQSATPVGSPSLPLVTISPAATTSDSASPDPAPSATVTAAPQPAPDLAFEQKGGSVTMTDRKTGLQITFPLEFKHTLKFVNGDNQTCFLNFDLSIEPFNGPYQEYCGSQIYINLHESGYDINLEGYNQPYKAVQRDNGSNLYIIGKEETKTRTCFDFAMDGIACEGSVDIDPAVYRRYETAIMGMLKSLTVIKNPTSVISTLPPSGDMDMESRSNGRQYLLARQFGMAFEIPQGFEHVLTYSGCKDFAILSIDLTKPPFNEPYDFNGLDKNLKSRIDICLYRGMKGKYPDEGDFIIYQRGGSGPDIVIINKLETDQFVNFDFEIPDSCCGGSVSVSRPFYEKYENSIFGLLHTILIENLQP